MKEHKIKIKTDKDYIAIMAKIDELMRKGENNLTADEVQDIRNMALAAQRYEKAEFFL